jgi:hypothetical protein
MLHCSPTCGSFVAKQVEENIGRGACVRLVRGCHMKLIIAGRHDGPGKDEELVWL